MGPSQPGRRGRKIPFPLFSLRGPRQWEKEQEEGGALEFVSTSWSSNNWGLPTYSCVFSFPPSPRFPTSLLLLPLHPPILQSTGSSGQRGPALTVSPVASPHLSCRVPCGILSHISVAALHRVKIQHVPNPIDPTSQFPRPPPLGRVW